MLEKVEEVEKVRERRRKLEKIGNSLGKFETVTRNYHELVGMPNRSYLFTAFYYLLLLCCYCLYYMFTTCLLHVCYC